MAPYAAKAADAETLGGRRPEEFVLAESEAAARIRFSPPSVGRSDFGNGPISNTSFSDVLSVTGFGQHAFDSAGTGGNILKVLNTASGSGNYSQIWLGTDEAPYVGVLSAFSSAYTAGPSSQVGSGTKLAGHYAGGLTLQAQNSAGSIRFFTGGENKRLEITSAGLFQFSGHGLHQFASSGSGGNIFQVRNSATGSSNYSQIWLGNDDSPYVGWLSAFSSTYTASGPNRPNGTNLVGYLSGGLSLAAINGSGAVRFFSGGGTDDKQRMIIDSSGKVGIGTGSPAALLDVAGAVKIAATGTALDVTGNISVSGTVTAKYQDVAEWVDAVSDLEDGVVVIIDPSANNRVRASNRAYDTRVAGAVSRQPGLVLGEQQPGQEMIAASGRVVIKVDATFGEIRVGDLLVTSPTPGYAMRSRPVAVGGRSLHQPGTVLGKALQPLKAGRGEILVLLSLQ